ncbi:hypothetical protein QE368_002029 [Asaia bogorensis NBRC 16594]|nr:hypothetical protein [Asaia bogorensis NBRC 16594]
MTNPDINVGDVVVCRNHLFVVVHTGLENAVLSPVIAASELRHRADLPLGWSDIAEANLPSGDMRVRAVPCLRKKAGLVRLGSVRLACIALIRQRLRHEMAEKDREGIGSLASRRRCHL